MALIRLYSYHDERLKPMWTHVVHARTTGQATAALLEDYITTVVGTLPSVRSGTATLVLVPIDYDDSFNSAEEAVLPTVDVYKSHWIDIYKSSNWKRQTPR